VIGGKSIHALPKACDSSFRVHEKEHSHDALPFMLSLRDRVVKQVRFSQGNAKAMFKFLMDMGYNTKRSGNLKNSVLVIGEK
jgi:hypothetical protein